MCPKHYFEEKYNFWKNIGSFPKTYDSELEFFEHLSKNLQKRWRKPLFGVQQKCSHGKFLKRIYFSRKKGNFCGDWAVLSRSLAGMFRQSCCSSILCVQNNILRRNESFGKSFCFSELIEILSENFRAFRQKTLGSFVHKAFYVSRERT